VISGYQLKAEHYQQLADRMGQALAQRLQQQIERGQWSMQLRLNPGELGQIDVQLDMRQNGLDARFQTENPVTKDLILMGSGRLKEGLQQHGMTIASVHVSSDGERQSNGNPTPQHEQQRRPHAPQEAKAPSEPLREANATKKSGANGLDMMA
jgi:flagellar hook-length control protein FliK